MFAFLRNAGIKSTFNSALQAAKTNSVSTQREIAKHVYDSIHGLVKNGAGESEWKALGLSASKGRQALNQTGNQSESNPFYARFALLESAVLAVLTGDPKVKSAVLGELFSWFESLGIGQR